MAVLFNVERSKYVELKLFSSDEPEWIAYKMYGGKICNKKFIELFRLDNDVLVFHDSYEKEVSDFINGLKNIKNVSYYRFTPKDEGEFLIKAISEDNMIYITISLYIIDKIVKDELQDNKFELVTTYSDLCDFLTQLGEEYAKIK